MLLLTVRLSLKPAKVGAATKTIELPRLRVAMPPFSVVSSASLSPATGLEGAAGQGVGAGAGVVGGQGEGAAVERRGTGVGVGPGQRQRRAADGRPALPPRTPLTVSVPLLVVTTPSAPSVTGAETVLLPLSATMPVATVRAEPLTVVAAANDEQGVDRFALLRAVEDVAM